jgi:hypothetical protein
MLSCRAATPLGIPGGCHWISSPVPLGRSSSTHEMQEPDLVSDTLVLLEVSGRAAVSTSASLGSASRITDAFGRTMSRTVFVSPF